MTTYTEQVPLQPKIEVAEATDLYGRFTVEPLERGFGVTLGNALRRVLLNSLPGTAVTAVRIEGVQHEYTTLPHVREDITEILLNVKGLRLRSLTQRPGTLHLDVTGHEGPVHASDITPSGEYEIVNPDHYLATLDSPEAALSMEFQVERGVGYQLAEGRDDQAIGLLPIDVVFTPIRRVNYQVERTRVGQVTDYDRLVLEVWTDRTITPQEAIQQAARILLDRFSLIALIGTPTAPPGPERQRRAATISEELYTTPVEALKLSSRTLNCLRRGAITTVGQVLERTPQELLALRNFGERSLQELYEKLQALGAPLPEEEAAEPKASLDAESLEGEEATATTETTESIQEPQAVFSAGAEEEEEIDTSVFRRRSFSPDDEPEGR